LFAISREGSQDAVIIATTVILNGEAREESQVTNLEILRALRRSG
jgi:hypothetical protein